MGMFDDNADYGAGNYLRVAGDYFLTINSVEYDDQYFPKYNVEAEVATGTHKGEIVQGTITRPTEKFMKDKDRAIGGFSFSQVGAYVVGAGITEEVNALPKITVGIVGKMLVGKTIKARVQLTRKSQALADQGETTGLYYEIGKIYKWSEWESVDLESVDQEFLESGPSESSAFDWLPPEPPAAKESNYPF